MKPEKPLPVLALVHGAKWAFFQSPKPYFGSILETTHRSPLKFFCLVHPICCLFPHLPLALQSPPLCSPLSSAQLSIPIHAAAQEASPTVQGDRITALLPGIASAGRLWGAPAGGGADGHLGF